MVRTSDASAGSINRLAIGLLESMASLWVLCTKQATRATKKLKSSSSASSTRSALTKPKQLLATVSNKAINFRRRNKNGEKFGSKEAIDDGFGDGGLWQKSILMGDRCQPLNFSGVIYYDGDGNRLSELPTKSPRASPLPNFAFQSSEKREREIGNQN